VRYPPGSKEDGPREQDGAEVGRVLASNTSRTKVQNPRREVAVSVFKLELLVL
jgi:hypothetical protein